MNRKPLLKRIKNGGIYWFIRLLLAVMQRLPRRPALALFEQLGLLAFRLLRREREKTLRHLRLAFGGKRSEVEIRALARECFRYLGRNAAEAVRLRQLQRAGLERFVSFTGREHLEAALAKGRGVICITGHLGCWELLAAFIAQHFPLAVVGTALYDPRLDALLVRERELAGCRNIPRTAGAAREMLRWLKSGGVLGILIDQDTRVDGEFVDFFGHPAYTPAGPVVFAERTGAPLVPLAIWMNEDFTHTVAISPEIPLQAHDRPGNVQRCSKAVEAFIREHPEQWVWMHERWKTKPQA
ncbi:MAG: lysophospholipid acyltransferase family protein [candidate division KSB1 bacterium]|nr:lysophospholipid acyltransferase family protein [candidate division KSB1 bacterium]MDZ7276053.1 lysophospholipid acyltransferase family protein [candidate division KSB1 bacterium]MDZ7285665.1 lysophospholipid acyltransferase family protein [candidate division KSB1 bacterium]MDZ7298697.1 lysophospholipid acyltransferase family protein [candidate division KSB1 bacterium]MDZ7307554.1 lysophospholipid acyltransferase family protein [candidate division KSB1 bacterium]